MNEQDDLSEELKDLVDAYLDGLLDESGYQTLEAKLRSDPTLLPYFVRYCRLHTDLGLETRVQRAGERVLSTLDQLQTTSDTNRGKLAARFLRGPKAYIAAAAVLLVALTGVWFLLRPHEEGSTEPIVWLANAQDCKWGDGVEPGGDLRPGKRIRIERGLAEFQFRKGTRLVLEGPADLELLSDNSARLYKGKLSARVPDPATGFTILSPQGKVIDLGTEFGVAVADDGTTDVLVCEGKVEAYPAAGPKNALLLKKDQTARLDERGVVLDPQIKPGASFKRTIVPPPVLVPRTLVLDFRQPIERSIRDAIGQGTGLTHRLPGTGKGIPDNDPNLTIDLAKGRLELTTTNSDINTQFKLDQGEYLGVRLADLGFTGKEDFEVTATIPNIPALQAVGQFGLYAGVRSDKSIRGGLISRKDGEYTQFLVHNQGGRDSNLNMVGLLSPGNDLKLTLKRTGGTFALTIENLTTRGTSTLTIPRSEFLGGGNDLYVGIFGANTQSEVRRFLFVTDFKATVWTTTP